MVFPKYKLALMFISAMTIAACNNTLEPKTTANAHTNTTETEATAEALAVMQPEIAVAGMSRDGMNQAIPPGYKQLFQQTQGRERYAHFDDNPLKQVSESPVSTFSIDVDTGSYANVRRFLNQGRWPHADAVRIEELINYFNYSYTPPTSLQRPFSVYTEIAPSPWNPHTHLLHIGVRGYQKSFFQLPPSNLVFLVDVSGSMDSPDKIGLLKSAMKILTRQMRAQDRIAIVVYAGAAGVVLEPTAGNDYVKIDPALQQLRAGGTTNGAAGIQLAYQLARQSFIENGVNRVLLATDGDFNVGTTDFDALKDLVKQHRESGIALTALGFGGGNYNDHLMEQLADAGNGNYAYIDTLKEARKVLVDERAATLLTIANDVKIQIEFNPAQVAEYRLLGYENRALAREDFNNDKVDAGAIGAGHTVTALYEITLQSSKGKRIDPLRYTQQKAARPTSDELAFLRLRYKRPGSPSSQLLEQIVSHALINPDWRKTSEDFRFAASVAAFAQTLRGSKYLQDFSYSEIHTLASQSRGDDRFGYRGEFLQLIGLAESLNTLKNTRQTKVSQNTKTERDPN